MDRQHFPNVKFINLRRKTVSSGMWHYINTGIHRKIGLLGSLLLLFILEGCHSPHPRSFYFWKTIYKLSDSEKSYLKDLQVNKLYIRFFDADLDESRQRVIPRAKIQFQEKPSPGLEIVPVIYLVNKALMDKNQNILSLADNLLNLTTSMTRKQDIHFHELQLDCDWTEQTQTAYFALVHRIRTLLHQQGKKLSVTIRLHQVKYSQFTGIPEADRGMLMYYNMGKINGSPFENSILNQETASRYTGSLTSYPLPLEVAFPLFSWGIHIRKDKVIELLNQQDLSDFNHHPGFKAQTSCIFKADSAFFYHGFYFMKNDLVKIEEVSAKDLIKAAKALKKQYNKFENIAFYHLDVSTLTHYEKEDLEKVSDTFN